MTHAEMIARMSSAEYARWIALYRREARDAEANQVEAKRKAQLAERGIRV